jgi:hypothetical protein
MRRAGMLPTTAKVRRPGRFFRRSHFLFDFYNPNHKQKLITSISSTNQLAGNSAEPYFHFTHYD